MKLNKILIVIIILGMCSLSNAGPLTASSFSVFQSAAKLWNICVDASALKYFESTNNPEIIANAALSSCENEGDITYYSMVDFLRTLDKNKGRNLSDIQSEAHDDYLEFKKNIVNRVTKEYLDIQIKIAESENNSNQKPKPTMMF